MIRPRIYEYSRDNLDRAHELLNSLGDTVLPAIVRALNRAADGFPTDAIRSIRGLYHLPAGRIRKAFSIRHAEVKHPEAVVTVRGRPIPLYLFGARPAQPGRRPSSGVLVDVMGRKAVDGGTFIARMRSGHVGVFKRTGGAGRLPMHELFGPAIPTMMTEHEEIEDAAYDGIERRFNGRIDHEVDQLFKRLGLR